MEMEKSYGVTASKTKLKKYGQYFTPYSIADFMTKWVLTDNAETLLDPAVGNGVFFKHAKKYAASLSMHGYEIDPEIVEYFNSGEWGSIRLDDFLVSSWGEKYDAIVCNPPYNRFQSIDNREEIRKSFFLETGRKFNGYTNQYVLFLIKSIYQMSDNGRLAFIIPSEFLDSDSGSDVKELMIKNKLLNTIISFDTKTEVFSGVTTTSCIVLLDKRPKSRANFYHVSSIAELRLIANLDDSQTKSHEVSYDLLSSSMKWRAIMRREEEIAYRNVVDFSFFAKATRGIATGDNSYFFLSTEQIKELGLNTRDYDRIISRSADVKGVIMTDEVYKGIVESNRKAYVFNPQDDLSLPARDYIDEGVLLGVNKKYLCAHRKPWYRQENKPSAPIWISPASRERLKVVRNLSDIKNSTTFHGIVMHESKNDLVDIFFCYLLTPIAQELIMRNKKEMGNGLMKFQPSDINKAKVLDITRIDDADRKSILSLYKTLINSNKQDTIDKMSDYFSKYLV